MNDRFFYKFNPTTKTLVVTDRQGIEVHSITGDVADRVYRDLLYCSRGDSETQSILRNLGKFISEKVF